MAKKKCVCKCPKSSRKDRKHEEVDIKKLDAQIRRMENVREAERKQWEKEQKKEHKYSDRISDAVNIIRKDRDRQQKEIMKELQIGE